MSRSTARAPFSFARYVSATSAPARAAANAIARPMPLEAPVTSATRPVSAAAVFGSRAVSVEKTGVVAAAYADAARVKAVAFEDLLEAAALGGAEGVLVDTADKRGPGLRQLVTASTLSRWIADAHDAGMFI